MIASIVDNALSQKLQGLRTRLSVLVIAAMSLAMGHCSDKVVVGGEVVIDPKDQGNVTGTVTVPSVVGNDIVWVGKPLIVVGVVGNSVRDTTEEDGTYYIKGLSSGKHHIYANADPMRQLIYGYGSDTSIVTVEKQQTAFADLSLLPNGRGPARGVIYGSIRWSSGASYVGSLELHRSCWTTTDKPSFPCPDAEATTFVTGGQYAFEVLIDWCWLTSPNGKVSVEGDQAEAHMDLTGKGFERIDLVVTAK